jgi:cytochrome c-type biogenesis protein
VGRSLSASTARARIPSRRLWIAAAVSVIVLAVTLTAALATGARVGGPVLFVERLSSAISDVIRRAGTDLRLAYAFLAGVVAAFNPCGFALLPAYLGMYLGDPTSGSGSRLARAFAVSGAVSVSFIVIFGLVGIVVGIASQAVVTVMPWIGLAVGVTLIAAGGLAIAGRFPGVSWGRGLASHVGRAAAGSGLSSYGAFGVGYALASLSCTLPVFLAVVGSTFATEGGLADAALQFVLFGAGMAGVLAVLTVVVSAFRGAGLRRTRNVSRYVAPASTVLLLAAGAYLVYYWLTIGRLLLA